MPEYKISVIIPVYNVEQYLDDAMNSLLNQTIGFENLQVVFADDCSTDSSGKMIDDYAEKHSNVTAIHLLENSGAAGTPQNEAIKVAAAPYLMILGSDDYFTDAACQTLYNKAEETGADIVYGDHKTIDEDGKIIYDKWPPLKGVQDKTFDLPQDLTEAIRLRDTICTKIYKRNFLVQNKIDFPAYIPGQDLVFYCKCLVKAKQIQYFSMPVYVYRIRAIKDPSISHIKTQKYFNGIEQCHRMCYDIFNEIDKLIAFDVLLYGVLDDYTAKMIDSSLPCATLSDILKSWQWIFIYIKEKGINHIVVYSDIIISQVVKGDFCEAAAVLEQLRPLRTYLVDTLNAKTYLEKQVLNYQQSDKNQKLVIADLKKWTEELEVGKAYLEQQVQNYQKSDEDKEKVILDLKKWTKELEEAKVYLEEQWNIEKSKSEKFSAQTGTAEADMDELRNTVSKLQYKLKLLTNDRDVQKIIKKRQYEI